MRYVLDASAIIAYLRYEPGGLRVAEIFRQPTADINIHSVNFLEVYYKLVSFGGQISAREALDDIAKLHPTMHDSVDAKLRHYAGEYKIRYPFLSLGDCICVALGQRLRAIVVTTDRPFGNIDYGVQIELIR